jgi:hypothetical protein
MREYSSKFKIFSGLAIGTICLVGGFILLTAGVRTVRTRRYEHPSGYFAQGKVAVLLGWVFVIVAICILVGAAIFFYAGFL